MNDLLKVHLHSFTLKESETICVFFKIGYQILVTICQKLTTDI